MHLRKEIFAAKHKIRRYHSTTLFCLA